MRVLAPAMIGALLLAAGAPAPLVGTASAQPAAATSRLPHVIALEGSSNFRDLGGYRTADGRQVRTGLVYRSASTDYLTASDLGTIEKLGIRSFCDLRDTAERQPKRPAGVAAPAVVTWKDQPPGKIDLSSPDAARQAILDVYRQMPELYGTQVGDILRRVAKGDLPLLFNCTAGKDRTGFTAAVLLKTLGVPHETVMADYLASNHHYDTAKAARLTSGSHPGFSGQAPDAATLAAIAGVDREWLEASFAAIDARYGSLDGYLKRGLGLSALEIAAIRRRMLEPARS